MPHPLAIDFPQINAVALKLGPLQVKWYGLSYAAGLILGWLYIKRLLQQSRLWRNGLVPFRPELVDDLLLWVTLGVVLGGRLGYVLFYEPGTYLAHPLEALAIWHGGMSFHGALVGTALAILVFARRNAIAPFTLFDLTAAAVPIGLFFGRIANFINAELWGRPTSVAWGMVFPGAGPAVRHPSQLYEATCEGLILFLVLAWLTHSRLALQRPGMIAGTFLIGYGLARSFCELFRTPDYTHAFTVGVLTPGIVYSIPMVLLGAWVVRTARSRAVPAGGEAHEA